MPPLTDSASSPQMAATYSVLSDGLRAVVATAHSGKLDRLWSEIEHYLTSALWADSAYVLVRAGGAWRRWDFTQHESQLAEGLDQVPVSLIEITAAIRSEERIFLPIVRGAVCATVHRARVDANLFAALDLVAASLAAAVATCEKQMVAAQNREDVQALQQVATSILKSHDLTEIMQLITLEAKRLLLSDICGIMLREGDAMLMKRCVGNYSMTTASLRMKPGQGIAGQVFATMQPCRVDDYLASEEISRDFFPLAQDEGVRSALAAPLLSHDEVIGVLEVWRRRPSIFTDLETTRLVALANLVSIAIENARLHADRQRTLQELERSNEALNTRYEEVRNLVALTEDLVRSLLSEKGIGAIAQRAAEHLDASVFLTDKEYRVHGSSGEPNVPADLLVALIAARGQSHEGDERAFTFGLGPHDNNCVAQGIFIAKELVGFVVVASEHAIDDSTSLAVGQIVLATALFVLEQRAVSRARSETLDAIVWDLLEGPDELRRTAIDRLIELKLTLPAPLRVVLIAFEDTGTTQGASPMGSAKVEERRRLVRDAFLAAQSTAFKEGVVGVRGNILTALIANDTVDNLERTASRVVRKLAEHPGSAVVLLGTSAPCEGPENIPSAYRDARTSIDVARQRGHAGAVVFERSGVVGLLFSIRQEGGIKGLLDATLGRLLREEQRNRQQLLDTLRVYFDVNYSLEAAAQRLGVHRKTISYRLARIAELTGLDLTTHEDRLLADLALHIRASMSNDMDFVQR